MAVNSEGSGAVKKSKLREARALISDPKNWTQHEYARNSNDYPVSVRGPLATKWCAVGAVVKVGGSTDLSLLDAARLLGFWSVFRLNDMTDHDTVLWMFDLAIAMEEVGE